MKFSYSLLTSFLPLKKSAEEIADALTQIGLEVDHLDTSVKDPLFTISLTPNLAHCTAIRGIARELAAFFDKKIQDPAPTVKEKGESIESLISVEVAEPEICPRYCARVITNIKNRESPPPLREKVEACGFRSVNAAVDITNLIMAYYGQPLHAFDYDRVEGSKLTVRYAKASEKLTTLDGKQLQLSEKVAVICDANGPVALAGVMGGQESEVSEKTTTLLLESAYFAPKVVRRSAKICQLQTEASYRFERGTDPLAASVALDHAAAMIEEHLGGSVAKGMIDKKSGSFEPTAVRCRVSFINRILGTRLGMGEVSTILKRLDLKVVATNEDILTAFIPTYRHDLHHEIDLVEEVARFYGYNNLKKEQKPLFRRGNNIEDPSYSVEKTVRNLLLRLGLTEFLTCDLISPGQAEGMHLPSSSLIHVLNPSSSDQSILRPSLLPGLIAAAIHNFDHRHLDLAAFEIGRVHTRVKESFTEQTLASIILMGKFDPPHFLHKPQDVDFSFLKGVVENLFRGLAIQDPHFAPSHSPLFHPGRSSVITVQKREVGILGQLHPKTTAPLDFPLYFAEIDIEALMPLMNKEKKMTPLPFYPATFFDVTLTVAEDVTLAQILSSFKREAFALLESQSLLDVYHGEKLGSEWKNITLRFVYRDLTKTIDLQSATDCHKKIISSIRQNLKEKAKDE